MSISSASTTWLVRSQGRHGTGKGIVLLARWPVSKAMPHARDRVRRTHRPAPAAAVRLVGYFRYGNLAKPSTRLWDIEGGSEARLRGMGSRPKPA
jgi:hypothetical protein